MRILMLASLVMLGGAAAPKGCETKKEKEEKAAERAQTPAINVSARELQKAYDDNEVAADDVYKGKTVVVTGSVESINKDIMDDPYVVLQSKDFAGVHCKFSNKGALASLKKRQKVTFRCVGDGYMIGSPMLDECAIE